MTKDDIQVTCRRGYYRVEFEISVGSTTRVVYLNDELFEDTQLNKNVISEVIKAVLNSFKGVL